MSLQQQTFRAARFEDAMAEVRRSLGNDALIVSRRQLRSGSGLRTGAAMVEITAISAAEAVRRGLGGSSVGLPEVLARRFSRAGVPEQASKGIVQRVRSEMGKLPRNSLAETRALTSALALEMMFAPAVGTAARIAVFVGPTGVGKTTTIAKLAAKAALIERKKVGLISLDHYRVGGVEQLQKYAEMIGIPMEAAHDESSLAMAVGRLGQADLILVDTAGRSPRDAAAFVELSGCLSTLTEPRETYLCLPAALRTQEIQMTVSQLGAVDPTRMVATKVDEAVCCAGVVAAQALSGLPVAYLTTGQRVPEDIECATPDFMAHLLSGSEEWPS